ncbi:MAG: asparagine synthase (glutamine-hydrolyzing) [Chromatiales bacterium]
MCGIVGHVVRTGCQPDKHAVAAAMTVMHHRGPDGEGMVTLPNACLGHRRLSIIDVEGSPQPWSSEDGRYTIVFNGEIYNYVELRAELQKDGFRFRSQGDTEVLLAAYVREGAACLSKLNGMFSFAIWDEQERVLFLARDRVGKKPLYYSLAAEGIIFASEFQALHAFAGIDNAIDLLAVQDFFAHQHIGGERTILRGIRKLRAGHWLNYREGELHVQGYWRPPVAEAGARSVPVLCEELRSLVEDAVKLRLRSDVPLGAFLSGGLDSSVVVAAMKRAGADVESFTVGFTEGSYDETAEARSAAGFFDTQHHDRTLPVEIPRAIENCLQYFGEPFADPSAIPTGYLCQHARERVTVALSGDGVDELFGGYRRYYARRRMGQARHVPRWLQKLATDIVLSRLPDSERYYGRSRSKQLRLLAHMLKAQRESPADPLPQVFTLSERAALFAGGPIETSPFDYVGQLQLPVSDPVAQMMLADLSTYLVDDILVKVDRMSMRYSLEVRSPFLDYRIVEFACRLPVEYKINGSVQKYLVRECFRSLLPPEVLTRGKHGFAVPLAGWFRGPLRLMFETDVVGLEPFPEFLNLGEVKRLWAEHQAGRADHGFKLWTLLAFCRWFRGYAH